MAGPESPDRVTYYNFTELRNVILRGKSELGQRAGSRLKLALVRRMLGQSNLIDLIPEYIFHIVFKLALYGI